MPKIRSVILRSTKYSESKAKRIQNSETEYVGMIEDLRFKEKGIFARANLSEKCITPKNGRPLSSPKSADGSNLKDSEKLWYFTRI